MVTGQQVGLSPLTPAGCLAACFPVVWKTQEYEMNQEKKTICLLTEDLLSASSASFRPVLILSEEIYIEQDL